MLKVSLVLSLLSSLAFAEGGADGNITQILQDDALACLASATSTIGPVLVGAFGIAVGFVVYKLVKRAINKA